VNEQQPTVSVVMATYNGEQFLREQMDSILAQTYPIKEIIVQDDCSTDGTIDIIRSYMESHANIRLFINERNLGYNLNFETAAKKATGDFIAISDQDDVWFPTKIERLVCGIGEHSLAYCDILRGSSMEYSRVVVYKPCIECLCFNTIVGHATLLRKEFAQDSRNYHFFQFFDKSLALAAHLRGNGIAHIEETLLWHRYHEREVTTLLSHEMKGRPSRRKQTKWAAYVYGWSMFRQIQRSGRFRKTFSRIYEEIDPAKYPTAKQLIRLSLSTSTKDLFKLCILCMKHRERVYPGNAHGLVGCLRGLFHPSIYAYFNIGLWL